VRGGEWERGGGRAQGRRGGAAAPAARDHPAVVVGGNTPAVVVGGEEGGEFFLSGQLEVEDDMPARVGNFFFSI
jgi:hypothetical protein